MTTHAAIRGPGGLDTAGLTEVSVTPLAPARFREVLSAESLARFEQTITRGAELLDGRTLWTVNSTAHGGGVAEMLRSLIGYARGAGLDARWLVIDGDADFFRVTKRLHNHLHGADDGGELGERERARLRVGAARSRPSCSRLGCGQATSSCCTTRRPPG